MADVISDEKGQIMLLTGFLAVIGVVMYITLLNNALFTSNMPSKGLDEAKQDIRNFRTLSESEVEKAVHPGNDTDPRRSSETELRNYSTSYINSYSDSIGKIYSARGASVDVVINNFTYTPIKSINVTIRYNNGDIRYNHTFITNI